MHFLGKKDSFVDRSVDKWQKTVSAFFKKDKKGVKCFADKVYRLWITIWAVAQFQILCLPLQLLRQLFRVLSVFFPIAPFLRNV